MRTIEIHTELPIDAQRVWVAIQSPATFLYVCRGLFGVPALRGRVEPFRVGERGTGWLFAFHVFPAYRHTIEVIDVDQATKTIRTHEHGGVITTWNHTLHVEPLSTGRCRYTDTVEIDAGRWTPVVTRVASAIYHYRHRRWHKLVDRHLLPSGTVAAS
ncbi:hypothetical protein NS506_01627 [Nocardia seriolae]|uniref:SRPBCC family protein n=1 Tax=Nocardia seriolae TaxID=37332 RepID=A0ABC8ANU8_9NOCA|nr:hypothetical protein [Nocardia seriolae]APA95697.1 hypothetical protein NS506_01627 [Nocardia seriolae]